MSLWPSLDEEGKSPTMMYAVGVGSGRERTESAALPIKVLTQATFTSIMTSDVTYSGQHLDKGLSPFIQAMLTPSLLAGHMPCLFSPGQDLPVAGPGPRMTCKVSGIRRSTAIRLVAGGCFIDEPGMT